MEQMHHRKSKGGGFLQLLQEIKGEVKISSLIVALIYEFNSQKLQTVKSKKMDIDKNSIHTTHHQHIRPTQYTRY